MTIIGMGTVQQFPVIVHRWFAGSGEGWAYHPDLAERLSSLVESLKRCMAPQEKEDFKFKAREKNGKSYLLGLVSPDSECEFGSANRRAPIALRAVVIDIDELELGENPKRHEDRIYAALEKLALPHRRGKNERLSILLKPVESSPIAQSTDELDSSEFESLPPAPGRNRGVTTHAEIHTDTAANYLLLLAVVVLLIQIVLQWEMLTTITTIRSRVLALGAMVVTVYLIVQICLTHQRPFLQTLFATMADAGISIGRKCGSLWRNMTRRKK